MKPSSPLCARLRFTTKQVGKGFYRGTRTGSMGAHTEYGEYLIDWRKVRHYNMPDLKGFYLTPFVTRQMAPTQRRREDPITGEITTPKLVDGIEFLQDWALKNPEERTRVIEHQAPMVAEQKARLRAAAQGLVASDAADSAGEEVVDGQSMAAGVGEGEEVRDPWAEAETPEAAVVVGEEQEAKRKEGESAQLPPRDR